MKLLMVLLGLCCTGGLLWAQTPLQSIKADTLRYWVQQLSHDSMQGRMTGTAGADKAADIIAKAFAKLGLQPATGADGFIHPFIGTIPNTDKPVASANVVGQINAAKPGSKCFIISAHYDHIGTYRQKQLAFGGFDADSTILATDSIFNGANDNASGIAAMLALARYFKQLPAPDYHILFVAFGGEEFGLLGSKAMADSIRMEAIAQVVNLEMLGRPRGTATDKRQPYVTYSVEDEWVIEELNKQHRAYVQGKPLPYFLYDDFKREELYKRSDNFAFAGQGFPSNTIMLTHPRDRYYHDLDDEWQTLDFELMEQVVRNIAVSITPLLYKSK